MADFKLFPGKPPERAFTVLKEVVDLPHTTLQQANSWLRTHLELLSTWNFEEVLYATKETPISSRDWRRVLNVISNFGFLVKNDDDLQAALHDLKILGFEEKAAESFKTLMEALRFPEAPLHRKVWDATNAVIPVVNGTSVVCDLRGVFEEAVSADASEHGVKNLLALSPVVILSLDIEDESGHESSVVVQFSETDFSRFARVIARGEVQLREIAKLGQRTHEELKEKIR